MVVCPKCGKEASFISEYNRYYCYSCEDYLSGYVSSSQQAGGVSAEVVEKVCDIILGLLPQKKTKSEIMALLRQAGYGEAEITAGAGKALAEMGVEGYMVSAGG